MTFGSLRIAHGSPEAFLQPLPAVPQHVSRPAKHRLDLAIEATQLSKKLLDAGNKSVLFIFKVASQSASIYFRQGSKNCIVDSYKSLQKFPFRCRESHCGKLILSQIFAGHPSNRGGIGRRWSLVAGQVTLSEVARHTCSDSCTITCQHIAEGLGVGEGLIYLLDLNPHVASHRDQGLRSTVPRGNRCDDQGKYRNAQRRSCNLVGPAQSNPSFDHELLLASGRFHWSFDTVAESPVPREVSRSAFASKLYDSRHGALLPRPCCAHQRFRGRP